MLKAAREALSLARSQEGDAASIFQTCEREKAKEQNPLSESYSVLGGAKKKPVPLAAATGSHQLDSLCEGKHPRPSLGKARLSAIPQWEKVH